MEGKAPESFRLKRSKSITSISDVHMKLLRLEDFLLELPSKIESIKKMPQQLLEKRNEMIAKKRLAENKMESGDYPKAPFQPKVLLILLLPFMPVFFYSLLVFFSSVFLFIYMVFIILYFIFLVAYFIAELAIRPPWYKPNRQLLTKEQIPAYWQGICNNPKVDLQLDYEDVEFVTKYDMVLRGWFVPAPTNVTHHNIGICFVHGGGRDRRAFLRHVPIFHYQGYDCLLFDFSEHGMSDGTGRGFSYGIREKEDVRFAVKWMKEVKGVKRVVVVGTSVGASSAIMAAAEDPSIDAVIAENPVACAEDFALYHLKTMLAVYAPNTYNSFFFKPFYMLVSRIFLLRIGAVFGYNRPYQLVDKLSPRPILLMHGTNDDVVPWDHSQRLFDAAKDPKELWLAENAWHCALFDMHPEDYGKKIHEFLNRYMHAELVDQKPLHSSKQVNVTTEEEEQKEKEDKEPRSAEEKEKEKEEAERARAQIHLVSDGGRTEEKTEEGSEEQN